MSDNASTRIPLGISIEGDPVTVELDEVHLIGDACTGKTRLPGQRKGEDR